MQRRPYQERSVKQILDAWKHHDRVLYTLMTGAGKTVVAVMTLRKVLERRPATRVLILAHRRELIAQMCEKLIDDSDWIDPADVGVILPDAPTSSEDRRFHGATHNPEARIQVASVDTLRNREDSAPDADIVVIDEAHRTQAATYQRILSWYPKAKVLGLTATPRREDGSTLKDSYDKLVIGASPAELVAGGWIASPRIFTKIDGTSVDLKGVKRAGGDYLPSDLSKRINTKTQRGDAVAHVRKRATKLRCVVFCCDVKHAQDQARDFSRAGFKTELLLGDTPKEIRDGLLGKDGRLARGETQIVVTCNVISEGLDVPPIKCAVILRPTRSLTLWLQQSGRILRPWKDPKTGKLVTPIILDHYGCARQKIGGNHFGFPDDNTRTWDLEDAEKNGAGAAPIKECENCGCECPAGCLECPECGHDFEAKRRQREKEEGELRELKRKELEKVKQAEIARIEIECKRLGKPELAHKIITHRFGAAHHV